MKNLIAFLLLMPTFYLSQTQFVYVNFIDKPNANTYLSNPTTMLSQKALDRRLAYGIPLSDQDAPIESSYVEQVKGLGITIISHSKWLNAIAAEINVTQKDQLLALACVSGISSFVKDGSGWKILQPKTNKVSKFHETYNVQSFDYGQATAHIEQLNLNPLHDAGYTGSGIDIAMIDTGFHKVNSGSYFQRIRDNNQIKGVYNIIEDNKDVYNNKLHNHGTLTLSTIASYKAGSYIGTAPDANFWLFVTEDNDEEIPQEEAWWIEAAEKADSIGVNIISSSLAYGDFFDDRRYNYNTSQMDGVTSFIAKGAKIATEKGILVVNAAANEGSSKWRIIATPADVSDVLTIGAVDINGNSAFFSSFGPTTDGRIKPDVSSCGRNVPVTDGDKVFEHDGTSFSCPIISGATACLIQAFPKINPSILRQKIRKSSHLYPNHTNQMGYGIPDFWSLHNMLKVNEIYQPENEVTIYPNPSKDVVYININENNYTVNIFDASGRFIKKFTNSKEINIQDLPNGIYLFSINYKDKTKTISVIKK